MSRKLPDFGPQVEALAKKHGISEHLTSIPTISRYLLSQYFSDTPECSVSKVCAALLDLAKQACGDGPADYLVRALGILEKFSDPANRTVEVTDGQHMILVWQVQEDLMQLGKLDFPEGSGRRWPSTTMRATRGLSSGGMPRTYTSGGSWAPSRGTLLGNPPLSTMVAARNRHLSQALTWVLRQHARDLGIANNDEDWRAAPGKKPKGRILEVTRTCPKRRREISRDGLLIRSVPPPPAGTR